MLRQEQEGIRTEGEIAKAELETVRAEKKAERELERIRLAREREKRMTRKEISEWMRSLR